MTEPSALLPCPFCGNDIIAEGYIRDGRIVSCMKCHASIRAFQPEALAEAITKWNTRAAPASEPVAWRWEWKSSEGWQHIPEGKERADALVESGYEVRALYSAPVPQPVRKLHDSSTGDTYYQSGNDAFEVRAPQPEGPQAREALEKVLKANDEFRAGMPEGWEGDPLQDACDEAKAALAALPSSPAPFQGSLNSGESEPAVMPACGAGEAHKRAWNDGSATWQIVPLPPTPEMLAAAERVDTEMRNQGFANAEAEAIYYAMLDESPAKGAGEAISPADLAEDCAKIAEGHVGDASGASFIFADGYDEACRDIAKAIRDAHGGSRS